jgi:hypothetical protein
MFLGILVVLERNSNGGKSYLKHDIKQPAFFVGMSLPPL